MSEFYEIKDEKLGGKAITFLPPEEIEPDALRQVFNTASLPFIHHHVAVMPDCHYGMGSTVGTVIATDGAIVPAAVGVDIGCGMIAVRTSLTKEDVQEHLPELREGIERRIPMSAGGYNKKTTVTATQRIEELREDAKKAGKDYSRISSNWEYQLGSLGSGNHFIELSLDRDGRVWAVLHSGSRGVGNKIAQHHIKVAKRFMKTFFINLPDPELAYIPEGFPQFGDYINDLRWAQKFALLNREEMMDRVMAELSYTLYGEDGHQPDIEVERINCHHNFTQKEKHFGKDVWITRKGAIQMEKGQLGFIPGSMGTLSYVVAGLEHPLSFHSAPHGAGRKMSRTAARKAFTMADFDRELEGVEVRRKEAFLDEIPSAYKDVTQVIEYAAPLVEVQHVLKQILNVKGD